MSKVVSVPIRGLFNLTRNNTHTIHCKLQFSFRPH